MTQALHHMNTLGWVAEASLVATERRDGQADIAFTKEGLVALKPFADLCKMAGGMDGLTLMAVFRIAVLSQE